MMSAPKKVFLVQETFQKNSSLKNMHVVKPVTVSHVKFD